MDNNEQAIATITPLLAMFNQGRVDISLKDAVYFMLLPTLNASKTKG